MCSTRYAKAIGARARFWTTQIFLSSSNLKKWFVACRKHFVISKPNTCPACNNRHRDKHLREKSLEKKMFISQSLRNRPFVIAWHIRHHGSSCCWPAIITKVNYVSASTQVTLVWKVKMLCSKGRDFRPEVKVSRNGPERRSGKRIIAGTAFPL